MSDQHGPDDVGTFDEFTELLGAFALDAVDDDERERIELHLLECPRCRAEVAEHREVAAVLFQSGAPAPEGVWDRIAAELSPPAPPMRLTVSDDAATVITDADERAGARAAPSGDSAAGADDDLATGDHPPASVVSIEDRRARPTTRALVALVAAAACIVAVLGVVAVGQSQRLNKLETALDDRSLETLANDVVAHSELDATLTGEGGAAQVVVGESGQGYLIMDDVPAPPEGEVYQLWGQVDDVLLSLGTFGGDTAVVPFSVDPNRLEDVKAFAVTQEKAPGVLSSENPALMAGEV